MELGNDMDKKSNYIDFENSKINKMIEEAKILCLAYEDISSEDAQRIDVDPTLVTAEEIQELNRQYRENDSVTDVLSFPQYESAEEVREALALSDGEVCIGDIMICLERAIEQAEEYGHSVEREVVYLFTHSMFHLLGYDHMEEDEKAIMRTAEETVMNKIGLVRE